MKSLNTSTQIVISQFFKGVSMVRTAISFFVLALVAFILGAYGIAGLSMEIGKILIIVFLALSIISFVGAMFTGKRIK